MALWNAGLNRTNLLCICLALEIWLMLTDIADYILCAYLAKVSVLHVAMVLLIFSQILG